MRSVLPTSSSLSGSDRELVSQMLNVSDRRKVWPTEYRSAEDRYLENFGILLQGISDDELASVISQLERQLGRPIPAMEAIP